MGLGADGEGLKSEYILKCRWKTESLISPQHLLHGEVLFASVTYF